MKNKAERMANMELLRIVSMMLVVVLHFLGKGGGLIKLTESSMPGSGYLAWILEAFAIVAVNVYMLISGFFLVESSFKVTRLLQLLLQIWFYSIGIGLVAAAFGLLPEEGFGIHYLLMLFFPVSMNHYWFMTAYVFMYLFIPMLSAGVKRLTKRQMQTALVLLILVFSVVKSIVPGRLEADMQGYDCIWYLCVFLLAAYIRLYGIPCLKNKTRSFFVYLAAVAGIVGVTFFLRFLYLKTGSFGTILTICYNYNHILVLIASVAFFYLFYHMRIKPGAVSRIVCRIAPFTLGVYLWHEHVAIRYEWQQWLYQLTGIPESAGGLFLLTVLAVVVVFMIGIILDVIRSLLFQGVHHLLSHIGIYNRLVGWLEGLTIRQKG
ncbi:MAG: acyltransferase [Lachnospiraceae bacterium]